MHTSVVTHISGEEFFREINELKTLIHQCISLLSVSKKEDEVLFTKKQAAAYLQICHVTLDRLIASDNLRCLRIGGILRIRKTDILKCLTAVRVKNSKVVLGNST